jgi:hypothetical protein
MAVGFFASVVTLVVFDFNPVSLSDGLLLEAEISAVDNNVEDGADTPLLTGVQVGWGSRALGVRLFDTLSVLLLLTAESHCGVRPIGVLLMYSSAKVSTYPLCHEHQYSQG